MNFKKILILISLIFILIVSVGVASATEDINNDINVVDRNLDLNGLNDGEIHDFDEIADEIINITGTYSLMYDYEINGVSIINEDNLVIDGNNHTLYGDGQQAFWINGNNVTIKNLNFRNCYANSKGGAIYWNGTNGVLINCNFVNCSAKHVGGAIFWDGTNGFVNNCNFDNCSVIYEGGAIRWDSPDGVVINCNFNNCSASYVGGGGIFWGHTRGQVITCNFVNCSTNNAGGGVAWTGSKGVVSDCTFVSCYSNSDGGAIFWQGRQGVVNKSVFVNCSAKMSAAGILWYGHKGAINYCIFDNCNAPEAKAIDTHSKDFTFTNNFFATNNITKDEFIDKNLVGYRKDPIAPNNLVILDIVKSGDEYIIRFVKDNGSALEGNMPNYNAYLTINGKDSKIITIENNKFSDTFIDGNYLLNSPNSGNILANKTLVRDTVNYKVVTYDCEYGETAIVTVNVPNNVTGDVTFIVDDGQEITETIDEGSVSAYIDDLEPGIHTIKICYEGDENYLPFNTTANVTVNETDDYLMNLILNNIIFGDEATLEIELPKNANQYVKVYLDGVYYGETIVKNGKAIFKFKDLKVGKHYVTVVYSGDKYYSESNKTAFFTVEDNNASNPKDVKSKDIKSKDVGNMENTGSPLIALLIALISLPIIRRK